MKTDEQKNRKNRKIKGYAILISLVLVVYSIISFGLIEFYGVDIYKWFYGWLKFLCAIGIFIVGLGFYLSIGFVWCWGMSFLSGEREDEEKDGFYKNQ